MALEKECEGGSNGNDLWGTIDKLLGGRLVNYIEVSWLSKCSLSSSSEASSALYLCSTIKTVNEEEHIIACCRTIISFPP